MGKALNIRKGDNAVVISGKDRGKKGEVLHVEPKANRIVIEGVNMRKKHRKPRSQQQPGGIITQEHPIDASNAMVVCPSCGKATRIAHKEVNGEKVRACKKCGQELGG